MSGRFAIVGDLLAELCSARTAEARLSPHDLFRFQAAQLDRKFALPVQFHRKLELAQDRSRGRLACGARRLVNSGLTAATLILLAMLNMSVIRSMLKRSPK